VNLFDLAIGLALLAAVVGGYKLGFLTRIASWGGLVIGLALAARFLPGALDALAAGGAGGAAGRLFLVMAGLLAGAGIGASLGEALGRAVSRVVARGPVKTLDRVGGAVVGGLGVLIAVWLLAPAAAHVPGLIAREALSSRIAAVVTSTAPRPPDAFRAFRHLVPEDRYPDVFESLRRSPDTGPPPAEVAFPTEVVDAAKRSTVNVESVGCGGAHEGSGWTAAPETVVTNAHVVAGADRVIVRRPDGRTFPARVVVFDERRDLAVLEAPGLNHPPLDLADPEPGAAAAVIGYPLGQNEPRAAPAIVQLQQEALGRDIYGDATTRRQVLFLAASLRQGDSGSAVINAQGQVVGTAFAIAPDRSATAYALAPSEVRAALGAPRRPTTGRCQ